MPAVDYTHSPTPEDIMEYLDGEGTAASRAAIDAHLAGCAACRQIASEQRGISEAAQTWVVAPAPASMRPPALPVARMWRPSGMVLGGMAAAAVLVVMVAVTQRGRSAARLIDASAVRSEATDMVLAPEAAAAPARRLAGQGQAGGGGGGLRGTAVGGTDAERAGVPRTPAVVRTATLRIVVKDFGDVRAEVESLVARAGGFIDQMTVTGDTSTARALRGRLRVPADRLADTLAQLRTIGQLVEDTQGSEDVTDQIVDLDARLASARATEQRLTELLRNRTGKLSDVLEVERELARVRLDIERLDADKTNVGRRVSYATIDVTITEERKAGLDASPLSLATRLRVAAADGVETALESLAGTVLFLLRAGPTLTLWAIAGGIAWTVWRRIRRSPPSGLAPRG